MIWFHGRTTARSRVPSFRSIALVAASVAAMSAPGCDPPAESPNARLTVDVVHECHEVDTVCYRPAILRMRGQNFAAGTSLVLVLRPVPDAGRPPLDSNLELGYAYAAADGTFSAEFPFTSCVVVNDPTASAPLVVAAVNLVGGDQVFTFIPRDAVVCRPPFVTTHSRDGCGQLDCSTLTTDSSTSIGVHWDGRDDGANKYRITYGRATDPASWITTRDFGDDVGDVAINNLEPGVLYDFRLQRCDSPTFGADHCAAWEEVGEAATA